MSPELLAALSEGQRAIAHLLVLLAVPAAVGLVYLVRRTLNRHDQTEREQITKEERRGWSTPRDP